MEKTCVSRVSCREKRKIVFVKDGYSILECKECGHQFIEIPDPREHVSTVYSDDYFFEGGRTAAFKQIGNAVPPLMAAALAKTIARLFKHETQ